MDKKSDCDVAYPNIMFCIDNFEEVFSSLHASSGQKIAVQLMAVNKVKLGLFILKLSGLVASLGLHCEGAGYVL